MAGAPITERNQDATVYVGGLDEKVNETILWELFVQAGPVVNVHMPKDRVTGSHQTYGFVEFMSEQDAEYSIKILNMIKLYGKPIRVNKASAHQKNLDVGANVFIGNLDPEVDEKLLYDTFSAFGVILQTPKIMRDPETGNSRGYAFINFASFEASDAAIEAMNGQYLCNRAITISYAFKKDAKGERHGSAAERLLAAQNPLAQADRPHQLFADAPAMPGQTLGAPPMATPMPMNGGAIIPPPTASTLMMPPPPPPPPQILHPHLTAMHHHHPPPPPMVNGAAGGIVPPPPPPGNFPGMGINPLYFAAAAQDPAMVEMMRWQMVGQQMAPPPPPPGSASVPPPPPPPPSFSNPPSLPNPMGAAYPPPPPPPDFGSVPPPPPPEFGAMPPPPPPPS